LSFVADGRVLVPVVMKAIPENLSMLFESLDEASSTEPFVRYNRKIIYFISAIRKSKWMGVVVKLLWNSPQENINVDVHFQQYKSCLRSF